MVLIECADFGSGGVKFPVWRVLTHLAGGAHNIPVSSIRTFHRNQPGSTKEAKSHSWMARKPTRNPPSRPMGFHETGSVNMLSKEQDDWRNKFGGV